MEIILGGCQKFNLYVGGDRRDKSLQSIIESTEHEEFFIRKLKDGTFEISNVIHVLPITSGTKKEVPKKKTMRQRAVKKVEDVINVSRTT